MPNASWKDAVFAAVPKGSKDRIVLSKTPLSRVQNVVASLGPGPKPQNSFWWGIGRSWIDWTLTEMPEWFYSYRYVYKIQVTDSVLRITNADELRRFNKEFRTRDPWSIDWSRVAERHAGVEIAPYLYRFRFNNETSWYYQWDVASGAAWDSSAVSGKELLLSLDG